MKTQEKISKQMENLYGAIFECGLDKTGDNQVIKLYIETRKSNCNDYIYTKYRKESIYFNSIFKTLRAGLGSEIVRTLNRKGML